MSLITYKEFEFDLSKLKEQDRHGKFTVLETITSNIVLDGLNHKQIIEVFEKIKQDALAKGFSEYRIIEEIDENSDYPMLYAVCARDETDSEYEQRLLKAAHKKKKLQIAAQKRAKDKKAAKKLKEFNNFYDKEF